MPVGTSSNQSEEASKVAVVWSCGGGTQSAAVAALIVNGKLPKPDFSIIVDTEREKSSTWAYYERVLKPELMKVGVDLVRVPKSEFSDYDLYGLGADNPDLVDDACLLPMFTTRDGVGKLPAYCSSKWKQNVVLRWCRKQGIQKCVCWMGISVDEIHRARSARLLWFQPSYPLIDLRMRRMDCVKLVQDIGWPTPPRSSCWMCPNHGNDEWREMAEKYPDDLANAAKVEREIQKRNPELWLHKSCKPIDTVDFSEPVGLFNATECASGYCFI